MSFKPSAFLESIIALLLPYFIAAAPDMNDARAEILDTLASYGTRTRAEMLQAAQLIALGMTTLDTLAEAKGADLSPSMRIRYRGCANNLNRSSVQIEKALHKRLACEPTTAPDPIAEPTNDLPDPEASAAIQQAQARIDHHRRPVSATAPQPTDQPGRNAQLWAGAMIDTLKQMGIPLDTTAGG